MGTQRICITPAVGCNVVKWASIKCHCSGFNTHLECTQVCACLRVKTILIKGSSQNQVEKDTVRDVDVSIVVMRWVCVCDVFVYVCATIRVGYRFRCHLRYDHLKVKPNLVRTEDHITQTLATPSTPHFIISMYSYKRKFYVSDRHYHLSLL